jgi:hypothetical protein
MHINGRLTGVHSTLAVLLSKPSIMKALRLSIPLIIAAHFISSNAGAQASLAPDQNPDFEVSRDKYMKISDSINAWHSTTVQDTYKAIDWLADRQEARAERRQLRRNHRFYRVGGYGYRNYNNYNYRGYYYPYNSYRRGYYNPNHHRRSSWWWNNWCF